MNQILVNKRLYVTPEFKKRRQRFKIYFALSIFSICLLTSYYIYAEWDRAKSEQVSKEILDSIHLESEEDNTTISEEKSIIVVDLDIGDNETPVNVDKLLKKQRELVESGIGQDGMLAYQSEKGYSYNTEAILKISKINLNYPVLSETSEELLKISLNKLWGPNPNEIGNYCIVGHKYKNDKMFGALHKLELGDIIELTDLQNRTVKYEIFNKYVVEPNDTSCTTQLTDKKRELTLITCTNYGKQRLVIKAREQK
ncbi:MAG: sortase [Clostridia bacterium]|nr:sortase [Clostridia bacterium]